MQIGMAVGRLLLFLLVGELFADDLSVQPPVPVDKIGDVGSVVVAARNRVRSFELEIARVRAAGTVGTELPARKRHHGQISPHQTLQHLPVAFRYRGDEIQCVLNSESFYSRAFDEMI